MGADLTQPPAAWEPWAFLEQFAPIFEDVNAQAFAAHRAADPHCTCPDCISYHEAHLTEGQ